MNLFLILAFLFFIGSMLGWVIEVIFRRFFSSANPERKWINPGFCTGPYIPLYGLGLCALYLIASIERNLTIENDVLRKAVLFVIMAISMTAIEYIAGNNLSENIQSQALGLQRRMGKYPGNNLP